MRSGLGFRIVKSLVLPLLLAAVAAGVVVGYRPADAAVMYSVSQVHELANLGVPYGNSADRSKIAGRITVGANSHAFVHSGGVLSDLGVAGGFLNSQGRDVNDLGQAVGFLSPVSAGFNADRAFVYSGGIMTQLPTLTGTEPTHAYGINNAGRVVGVSGTKPFIYTIGDAALTPLGMFQASLPARAMSINEAGTVVGFQSLSGRPGAAVVWRNGVESFLPAVGFFNDATFINDAGVIIGHTFDNFTTFRAMIIDEAANSATDLGTLGGTVSDPVDVNSSRQVVGWSRTGVGLETAPFLWDSGTMVDLNSLLPPASGWVLTRAISIDDAGEIIGIGTFNGTKSGFKLTPVPEPAAIAGVTAMTVAALLRRPGRRRYGRPE
jgi:probable HAF family extracellular repeat protein